MLKTRLWILALFMLCMPAAIQGKEAKVEKGYVFNLNDQEKSAIRYIIEQMGTKNLISLFSNRNRLTKVGDSINHVPPLQFLGYIFSNPDIKKHMYKIRKSSFKWNQIVSGIKKGMAREYRDGILMKKIDGFAALVKKDPKVLLEKAQQEDWEGFVKSLL